MADVTTVVIGAGHCGLAVSRYLAERSHRPCRARTRRGGELVAHPAVGLAAAAHPELDDPAARLRLPRRRPGRLHVRAAGGARSSRTTPRSSPRRCGPTPRSPRCAGHDDGYLVQTDQEHLARADGRGRQRAGRASPSVPRGCAQEVPAGITTARSAATGLPATATPPTCRTAGCWWSAPSASGIQIAQELHRSGRPVTLAVGEHVRMPRTYRGRDILWWMDASGLLDERYDEVPDLLRARDLPSMQLVGTPERATLDLNALSGARGAAGRHGWPGSGTGPRCSPGRCPTCARWPT